MSWASPVKLAAGKVAVITGAASGVGQALAVQVAFRGLSVVLSDLPGRSLERTVDQVTAAGAKTLAVSCDVRRSSDVQQLAATALDRFGTIDAVFLNAGVFQEHIPLWETDDAVWDQVVQTNLRGVAHGITHFVPILIEKGSGHVVITASLTGLIRTAFVGAYAASKFAVIGMSESLAAELAERAREVKVTVVCPGLIRTPMTEALLGPLPAPGESDPVPADRALDPGDVARGILAGVETDQLYVVLSASPAASRIEDRAFDIVRSIADGEERA
jgi:NAD(P)-dependent dehydrogenase (short-subunit alcohol dehydrogenase family)